MKVKEVDRVKKESWEKEIWSKNGRGKCNTSEVEG